MADFFFTGPDGKRIKVSGPDREGAIEAFKQHLAARENVVATTQDGGKLSGWVMALWRFLRRATPPQTKSLSGG